MTSGAQDVVEAMLQDKAVRESPPLRESVPPAVQNTSRGKAVTMLCALYLIALPLSLIGIAVHLLIDLVM